MNQRYLRGTLIHFTGPQTYVFVQDGLIAIQDGKIVQVGQFSSFDLSQQQQAKVEDHSGKIIMPGFIDTHVHYAQMEIVGSFGQQLLQWLEKYTFVAQKKFNDKQYAKQIAKKFLQSAANHGTTSMVIFTTVFPESVDALFEQAEALNMEVIAGKVLMDRNCPEYLRDTPQTGYQQSLKLIKKWHNKGRLHYAVTPRFAPTSSPEQLETCKKLLAFREDLYFHTHASENKKQLQYVNELFPQRSGYMDVYNHYGLIRKGAVYAHCIHLSDQQFKLIHDKNGLISVCADSNSFLGSGIFNIKKARQFGVDLSIGSDVGAGTTLSMFKNLGSTYKVMKLSGETLGTNEAFYYATYGAAKGLNLDKRIGKIQKGYYADLIIINPDRAQNMQIKGEQSVLQTLFTLMMTGDDRCIVQTLIAGKTIYKEESSNQC